MLLHFAAGLSGPSVHITFALRRDTPHFTYPTLRPAAFCGVTERLSLRDIYPYDSQILFTTKHLLYTHPTLRPFVGLQKDCLFETYTPIRE